MYVLKKLVSEVVRHGRIGMYWEVSGKFVKTAKLLTSVGRWSLVEQDESS